MGAGLQTTFHYLPGCFVKRTGRIEYHAHFFQRLQQGWFIIYIKYSVGKSVSDREGFNGLLSPAGQNGMQVILAGITGNQFAAITIGSIEEEGSGKH